MLTIAVLGTMDTKGSEHSFVAECIRQRGHRPLLIDVGSGGAPTVVPDISSEEVRRRSHKGDDQLAPVPTDRGDAIAMMATSAAVTLRSLVDQGAIQGVISLGGTGGTAIGTSAMRALPLGFPKVMVSTVAGGNVSPYVDISDITMMPSIVDVSGLNQISRVVFSRAAAAVVAMAESNLDTDVQKSSKPVIVASMFGNTTRCVEHARRLLEAKGYEVIVFHATGIGGRTMEALIDSGMVKGVLDITTTEWADEIVGGMMRGGPDRLNAAARMGIPAVIAPGCLDMVNFCEPKSIPEPFRDRKFYHHNPQITLMRTTPQDCTIIGHAIANKLNASQGPVHVLFPLRAISVISARGQPFFDSAADQALLKSWKSTLRPDIPFEEIDCEINDPLFSEACVDRLLAMLQ